jgi:hypothetical protein
MSLFHVFSEMFNNQENVPVTECKHVGSSGDCNLIQKLKELQAEKKEVDQQIVAYEKCDCSIITKFVDFMVALHEDSTALPYYDWHRSGSYSTRIRDYYNYRNARILERPLSKFTMSDIEEICNELKLVKKRTEVLCEKRELSQKLATQIKEIKDTLGIE